MKLLASIITTLLFPILSPATVTYRQAQDLEKLLAAEAKICQRQLLSLRAQDINSKVVLQSMSEQVPQEVAQNVNEAYTISTKNIPETTCYTFSYLSKRLHKVLASIKPNAINVVLEPLITTCVEYKQKSDFMMETVKRLDPQGILFTTGIIRPDMKPILANFVSRPGLLCGHLVDLYDEEQVEI